MDNIQPSIFQQDSSEAAAVKEEVPQVTYIRQLQIQEMSRILDKFLDQYRESIMKLQVRNEDMIDNVFQETMAKNQPKRYKNDFFIENETSRSVEKQQHPSQSPLAVAEAYSQLQLQLGIQSNFIALTPRKMTL